MFFLLIFLNTSSKDKLKFDTTHCSYSESDDAFKNDSTLIIPKKFSEFQNNSKGFCLVRGNSTKKHIALTFDDGPTEVTEKIVKILNKFDAKGTFFWVGERIKSNENIIKDTKESGHLIANHSWNHENGLSFSNQLLWESQVNNTFKEFAKYGINEFAYYRPPFGEITQKQIDFLASKNIVTVLWSLTTLDWDINQNNEDLMFQQFKKNMHPGAIVLMHDYDFGNLDSKLKNLEKILNYGKSRGYKFVNVEEIL